MNFLKKLFQNIALFLHGDDKDKAKRATALVLVALLFPGACAGYYKALYKAYYVWKNNQPPSVLATAPSPIVVDNERELPFAGPPAPKRHIHRPQ